MQLTELPFPLVTLQQTIDQWIKTVPNHNPELATQLRSGISDVNATIVLLQQQLTWEREQRQRAESEVRFLERTTPAIDQPTILEYQRTEAALAKREELLRTVVTNPPTILYALDRDGIFILSEGKGLEAMNLKSGEVVGRSIFDLYKDHPDMLQAAHQVLNGAERELILNLNGITIADYLSIVLQETQAQQERQRAEERLRLFESVVVNGRDSVIITTGDPENPQITYVNAAFIASTGYAPEEVIGKTPRLLQGPKSDRAQLNKVRQALLDQKSIQIELVNYRKNGSEFWVDLNLVPILDDHGALTHYVALQRDITDRKWAEKALIATQARLKYLLSSNPSVIYTCHPNRNRSCTFVSENIAQQLGYEVWQYLKESRFWLDRIHPDDLSRVLEHVSQLFEIGQLTCEYRFLHKDGSYRWLRDGMKLLRDQGQPVEIIGSVVDITDRKRAENQIRASLEEKEVLLKEIHHRVKNNLQVISSLLKLQAGYIKDDRILEVFKESQNRVRAMALIHEKLYQSEDLAKSNFAEYIHSLATDLFRSYSVHSRMVKLNLNVKDVRLIIDTAIPCGLIINELISNSLKYAFSAGQTGEINIHFFSETEDCYTLIVQDNGSGFPIDLDFRNTKSLGLQLVCSLTKQLHGTIDLERDRGVAFKITFAEQKQKG